MEHAFNLIQDLALIVIFSTALTWLFSALRLPVLLGFITAGILLSPVLGLLRETENIAGLGELGVLFMMFFVGMEFNPERLKKVFAPSLLGISAQIAAMGALGLAAARLMGMTALDGVFLGGVLAMSSTVVIMEIFERRGVLNRRYAQITVGVLIIEDLFAVFLLVLLSSLAMGRGVDFGRLGESVLAFTTFVVTIYVVGKLSAGWLSRRFRALENPQAMIMFVFCAVLGLSRLAHAAGLSQALGAFLAGSVLSGTGMAPRAERLASPFRNLFVALFFVSVGTMIQPGAIMRLWQPIAAISVCVIVFQTAACFTGIVLGGAGARDAYYGAINKAQIGEFSFVIAGLGISLGVMNPDIMVLATGVSFITVFVNPFLSSRAENVADFFAENTPGSVRRLFDRYKKAVAKAGARRGENQGRLLRPALAGSAYLFIFNGAMVLAAFALNLLRARGGGIPGYAAEGVWLANALVSLPLLAGLFANARHLGRGLFGGGDGPLARATGAIFAAAAVLVAGGAYAAVMGRHFPGGFDLLWRMAAIFALAAVFRRRLRKLDAAAEDRFAKIFRRHLENAEHRRHDLMIKKIREDYAWAPDIAEVRIPENAEVAGKTVREAAIRENAGSDAVAIRRGEFVIYDVMAGTHIFPNDTIVLSGLPSENLKAREILTRQSESEYAIMDGGGLSARVLSVSEESPMRGKTLGELRLTKSHSAKVVAMGTAREMGRPDIKKPIAAGDILMFLGPREEIERLRRDFRLSDCDPRPDA